MRHGGSPSRLPPQQYPPFRPSSDQTLCNKFPTYDFSAPFRITREPSSRSVFSLCYVARSDHLEARMGQSKSFRSTALIVEDDPVQREMLCVLLEQCDFDVVQCESAEAAERVLQKEARGLALMMTDVSLAGRMNGVELAYIAKRHNPELDVVVTSGRPLPQPLPDGTKFWSKPWAPLDVLREATWAQTMAEKGTH
jgi:two-component system cell cycle response regulator CpdR